MIENCLISPPINFNCWKHHAVFIKSQTESIKTQDELDLLKIYLLRIGESQMDLYFGKYSPREIAEEILGIIYHKKIFSSEEYFKWLTSEERDYRLITLKDKSVWALRLGETAGRYVHIHPGRYSAHTVRVKATSLKTAIFVLCFEKLGKFEPINTESVNSIRVKYLNEPPLKSISKASGLVRLLDLFHKKL